MDFIKKLFPQTMQANDLKGLLIAILIYAIVNLVGGFVLGLLDGIPLVGFVFGLVGWVLGIYCAVGIIVSILVFFKIVK
ncbi:MAG: hypothetical protein J6I97_06510 [Agathobacter sp.]|nr:hypothetical protein [Agathobacter sp.]